MVNNVEIINHEDPSVQELINKTAEELHKKYNKQRKINEKFLKKKTPAKKVFSIFLDIICATLLIFGFTVCFSIINTTIHGYMPNFAGYTNLVISSKSMVASGYDVGDVVVVHSVDAKTLNVNDKIAFYVYAPSYVRFKPSEAENVSSVVSKTKFTLRFEQLFGFPNDEVKNAVSAGSKIVFHHIREIYVDANGERWFKTYGSSNGSDDSWWINEDYVVGIQDESVLSKSVIGLVELATKPHGIIILAIPVGILIFSLIVSFLKNIQIAKLELDCVEEKRKITDPICVKNNVGYQMGNKTKYKILAQATDENREEYIKLLWKDGKSPNSIKKYYMRKKLFVNTNKELLELNRECEKMFKDGKKPNKIAQYYLTEKQKIEDKNEEIRMRLKLARKQKIQDKNQAEVKKTNKKRTRK